MTPAAADRGALEFSVDDIRAAGSGLFGTVSAELAAVIEYMFKSYGRPTGYILGTEGGAALVAGLRYGEGMLVTKLDGERKIYWQGPSVGYDLGLTGSRTMILIYNINNPDEILQRFGGVDGSAYLVGGAGGDDHEARSDHSSADPHGSWPAPGRQYRLPQVHAARAVQSILIAVLRLLEKKQWN